MKGHSTFFKAPELEPYHQMQFSVISRTLAGAGVLPLSRDAVGIFYSSSRLGSGGVWRLFKSLWVFLIYLFVCQSRRKERMILICPWSIFFLKVERKRKIKTNKTTVFQPYLPESTLSTYFTPHSLTLLRKMFNFERNFEN